MRKSFILANGLVCYEQQSSCEFLFISENATLVFILIVLFTVAVTLLFTSFFYRKKVQYLSRIIQEYEASLLLKKEILEQHNVSQQPDVLRQRYVPETIEKNIDPKKASKLKDMSEKFLPELERLFKEAKIYKQPGLSVDDVAKKLNTNRTYLSSVFSEHYQIKFPDYVNTFRVEAAIEIFKEMHKGGRYAYYTVQAVSEEVGFNTRASFYIAFKQIVGITPTEYLKTLNNSVMTG